MSKLGRLILSVCDSTITYEQALTIARQCGIYYGQVKLYAEQLGIGVDIFTVKLETHRRFYGG